MSVQIITDSGVDAAARFRERFTIIPLRVSFGDTDYSDGVTLNKEDFYKKLETADVLPKTSQATPPAFEKVFRRMREEGKEAVVITVTSRLSGTYQNACLAAEDYPNIRVVDSRNVAIGSGVLAEYAQQCADRGMGLDELAEHLVKVRDEVCLVASVDTLEYLKKGGRISGTVALVGGFLNIKPIVAMKDGVLVSLGKARGSRKANSFLIEQIRLKGVDYDRPILFGYTGLSDQKLRDFIHDSQALWEGHVEEPDVEQLCSVIGTHAGPGAVVTAFFRQTPGGGV